MFNLKQFLGLTYYTSALDQFLKHFDRTHPKLSESQRNEINKYNRIYNLRDNPAATEQKKTFWDKF